jgi:hypothetical protein
MNLRSSSNASRDLALKSSIGCTTEVVWWSSPHPDC